MRKKCAGQTGCYLSKCIRSIRKTVTTSWMGSTKTVTTISNLYIYIDNSIEEDNKCTYRFKPSTPSPVTQADYVSPYKEKYWAVKTKNIRKQMKVMKEAYILEAINKLRTENPEMHDDIINYLVNQYDEYNQSSEEDVAERLKDFSKEMEL